MMKSNFLQMEIIKSRLTDPNVSDYIIYLEQSIDNIYQKLNHFVNEVEYDLKRHDGENLKTV